jgi:hypothetical protein
MPRTTKILQRKYTVCSRVDRSIRASRACVGQTLNLDYWRFNDTNVSGYTHIRAGKPTIVPTKSIEISDSVH